MARKLGTELVEKPWGRTTIPQTFGSTDGRRIGEVWFAGGDDLPLLAKYIFTSERLSIQVHPNDEQAAARNLARGKSECWLILEAEADAVLGLGLTRAANESQLRTAALDGSIEELLHWQTVEAGDFFMVPAGTIHAIGAGISLLEFQQNSDTTYRLYDYGRPRELHLDDAVQVARGDRYEGRALAVNPDEETVLAEGPHFCLVHTRHPEGIAKRLVDRLRWVLPLDDRVRGGGVEAKAGECLLLSEGDELEEIGGRALVGTAGAC